MYFLSVMKHSTQTFISVALTAIVAAIPAAAGLPLDLRGQRTSPLLSSHNAMRHGGNMAKGTSLKSLRTDAGQTPIWRPSSETIYFW